MKHEVTTFFTKKLLAESLKKIMKDKPFSKITVTEIIADCQLNRKTFYYHFKDINELLQWFLEQETFEVLKAFDLLVNYEDALLFVMDYIDSNAHILNCALDSLGREQLKQFLFADFISIIRTVIDGIERELELHTEEAFKEYLCQFYAEGVAGMLIAYVKNDDKKNHEKKRIKTIRYLSLIFRYSLPEILLQEAGEYKGREKHL